jgi:glutaredoxin-related protein
MSTLAHTYTHRYIHTYHTQVYNKGSLVGGLDIMKELAENGELKEALS